MSHRTSPRRPRARLSLETLEGRQLLDAGGFQEFALPKPATSQFVQVHDIVPVSDSQVALATTQFGPSDPKTGQPTYLGTSLYQSNSAGTVSPVHPEGDASRSSIYSLVQGPDGNLWGIVNYAPARLNPDGSITRFPLADGNYAQAITAGADGALWFTEPYHGMTAGATASTVRQAIGRITPSGQISEYLLPQNAAKPDQIALGPDRSIWFTLNDFGTGGATPALGKVNNLGAVAEYPLSNTAVLPHSLTTGPDGNIWFTAQGIARGSTPSTDTGSNFIGKATPSGAITLFPLGAQPEKQKAGFVLGGITPGPDGNVWFAEPKAGRIGSITPGGSVNELPVPTADSAPTDIALGRDGALWFTELLGNKVGRYLPGPDLSLSFTPAAAVTNFSGTLATLRDSTPGAAGSYATSIDWGDGSAPTSGTVTASGGQFTVSGSHTYAQSGNYTVKIAVQEPSGESVGTSGSLNLAPPGATGAHFAAIAKKKLGISLSYAGPIVSTLADDVTRYTLSSLGKPNRKGVRRVQRIALKSAVYDPKTGTVLLTPRKAITRRMALQVAIRGEGTLTVGA